MGKNRDIQIIGKLLGGMVAHKILEKYTNRKESLNHLRAELNNYRDNVSFFIQQFNWNDTDKILIRKEAKKNLENELKKEHFNDVIFPDSEKDKILGEVMKEMFG